MSYKSIKAYRFVYVDNLNMYKYYVWFIALTHKQARYFWWRYIQNNHIRHYEWNAVDIKDVSDHDYKVGDLYYDHEILHY